MIHMSSRFYWNWKWLGRLADNMDSPGSITRANKRVKERADGKEIKTLQNIKYERSSQSKRADWQQKQRETWRSEESEICEITGLPIPRDLMANLRENWLLHEIATRCDGEEGVRTETGQMLEYGMNAGSDGSIPRVSRSSCVVIGLRWPLAAVAFI